MLFDKDLKSDFQTQRIASDVLNPHRFDEIDRHDTVVKLKWRGTSQDKLDMATIGRHQTLRVRGSHCTYKSLEICPDESVSGIFHSYECYVLGFGSTLICTWRILFAWVLPGPAISIRRGSTLSIDKLAFSLPMVGPETFSGVSLLVLLD